MSVICSLSVFQSYVGVGHLSADYSGLHSGGSLGGSIPYTSGLGQALAGQHTRDLNVYSEVSTRDWAKIFYSFFFF